MSARKPQALARLAAALSFAAVMTLFGSESRAEVTFGEYAQARELGWFADYILGVGVGISWANTFVAVETGRRLFCVPQGKRMNGSDYRDVLDRQIAAAASEPAPIPPDTAVELLLLRGLQREFPCGPLTAGLNAS